MLHVGFVCCSAGRIAYRMDMTAKDSLPAEDEKAHMQQSPNNSFTGKETAYQ